MTEEQAKEFKSPGEMQLVFTCEGITEVVAFELGPEG